MGVVHCLHGGDLHGQDRYVQKQRDRLVPQELQAFNFHRFDMSVPAQRFAAWDTARTEPWGDDQVRVVVMDNAQALDGLKGSGKFKTEEEMLTPSAKGNKLASRTANALVADLVGSRASNTHLIVLLRNVAPAIGVTTPLVDAAREDGRLIEYSKSAAWDKDGRVAHVQRVAQGLGMLVDADVAERIAEQLGTEDDGQLIESELRKLQFWAAATDEIIEPETVGELCSSGAISPFDWCKELVSRPRSSRKFLARTRNFAEQGVDVMLVLGLLLTQARNALLFKTLEAADADQGTIAGILGWSNPRRFFPVRRELANTTEGYIEALIEATLQLRERILSGRSAGAREDLQRLCVEAMGELNTFQLRQQARW